MSYVVPTRRQARWRSPRGSGWKPGSSTAQVSSGRPVRSTVHSTVLSTVRTWSHDLRHERGVLNEQRVDVPSTDGKAGEGRTMGIGDDIRPPASGDWGLGIWTK